MIERLEQWDDEHPSSDKKVGDDHKAALARQPVPIGAIAAEMGPKEDGVMERLARAGPHDPPVYDDLGFELDYEQCMGGPRSRSGMVTRMERVLDRRAKEKESKERAIGVTFDGRSPRLEDAWDDRVSQDLQVPFHTVGPEEYRTWKRRGFTATAEELEEKFRDERERERLDFLMCGSKLRKGRGVGVSAE